MTCKLKSTDKQTDNFTERKKLRTLKKDYCTNMKSFMKKVNKNKNLKERFMCKAE